VHSLSLLDIAVLVAYLGGTTWLGLFLGRGQKDARDYFVADHAIPWWAICLSIVASETSALTFISIPGLAWAGNLGFLQVVAGYIVGRIVIAFTLLPKYFEGELVTAYTLLERRFGVATRRFASITFLVTRAMADSVRVFATAIPVSLILGKTVPTAYSMPAAVIVLGLLTVLYTYRGGMRAVVWTELVQAGVYVLGGSAALVLVGRAIPGGWSAIIDKASILGKLQVIDTSFVLSKPHTLWAGLFGGGFLAMASHGTDQLIVQRLLASRSLKDAQRALIASGFIVFAQFTLFLMVGVGLWDLFAGRAFASADTVFPTFIIEYMPSGLLGLVLAAIVAATMSTHAGTINALAAATTHDIYLPMTGRSVDDPRTLAVSKRIALLWGVGLTLGALLYRQNGTPVVVIALSIASFTYGGLLGAFLLGLLVKRARQRDAIPAMATGIAVMSVVVFAKQLTNAYPSLAGMLSPVAGIAWPWYVLIGTSVTLAVGTVLSTIGGASRAVETGV
jgi:SSS family transporter